MKKTIIIFAVFAFSLFLYAFKTLKLGAVSGQVTPVESLNAVMLVSGLDTLKVQQNQGVFRFGNLKQRVYTLIVKSNAPYQDFILKNVAVKDSCTTNVGKIIMKPQMGFLK